MRTLLLVAAAVSAYAQGPASTVQIVSPNIRAMVGQTMQLQAVVRDAVGVERPGDSVQWTIDNAALATVTPTNGLISARGLGFIRVTAAAGAARGSLLIQILPKRIAIEPTHTTLTVNDRHQFRAVVYDVNDQPIANVALRWFTASGNGFTTNAASIDNTGMLRTVAVGNIQVRASFDYNANGASPGFERQAQAMATATIEPPKTYTLRRLAGTSELRRNLTMRARIVPILGNDRGQLVFNTSLDGLGNGTVMIDGPDVVLLGAAGMPGPMPQTSIVDFNEIALNNRGVVLARMSAAFSNNFLYKMSREDGADVVFIDNTPLPGTEFLSGFFTNRNSLNDSGDYIMRANYRIANSGPTYSALFRVRQRGFPDEVVNNREPLGEMAAGFTIDNDFGLSESGLSYFTATSGTRRFLWARSFGAARKLLATGDALLNSTVRSFFGNGFFLGMNGDLAAGVTLSNNEIHLLRYAGTNVAAPPRSVRIRSLAAIYAVSPDYGVLFLGDGNRGYGVYLWKDGEPTPVFLQNHADYLVRGKRIPQIDYAALRGSGDVTMLARSEDHAMELLTLKTGEPALSFLQAGFTIDGPAPMSIAGILQGARSGPPHLFTGGFASSIWEVTPAGMKPAVLIGERYAGVQIFTGANNTNARKAPNGDIYTSQTGGGGILRVRGDQKEFVLRPPIALETGVTANAPFSVAVNTRGDLLWTATTNRGDQRLVLTREGKHTSVVGNGAANQPTTEVDGRIILTWANQVLDDAGRVMATLRFTDNSTGLYFWDGANWKHILTPAVTQHAGRDVVTYSTLRASADTFYVVANLSGLGNTLLKYRDRLETAIATDDPIVTGHLANSIGTFDVNRSNDVFVQCNTNTQVLVVKRGNRTHYIHALNEPTAEGDLIVRTTEYDIRDDGTVYFLGLTANDEYVLYQATPVN